MESWDVRAISASYTVENDEVVIEIFGRTSNGESITVRNKDFLPYFFIAEPDEQAVEEIKRHEEYIGSEWVNLWVPTAEELVERKCLKVTIRHPWKVPDFRNRYKHRFEILASDIPFAKRFIYDNDIGSSFRVTGERIESEKYTTELVVDAESFENIESVKPPLKILSFDIENSINTREIYTIGCAVHFRGETTTKAFSGDEGEIIGDFLDYLIKEDPDIITGYNIDGYDIPLLLERSEKLRLGKMNIGRDGSPIRSLGDRFWKTHGRVIADAWWNAKRELRPKKETLNHISLLLLGEKKDDVNPRHMDEEWKNNREKVIKYCIRDAVLALKILLKIDVIEKNLDLATVSKLPLDDVLNGNTSALIDSILIRETDRRKVGVPQMKFRGSRGEKIEGGYVHSIQPGLYHWVIVLDFKSMYPSTIIANNICFTTISPKGSIVSPIGVKFLDKSVRKGILPEILEELMKKRDETKRLMREAEDEEERRYYNGLQAAIKILMNSFYGVFASSFYRFTNKSIGASITAFSRENIKTVIKKLEDKGYNVIYSDTDSVFFESPEKSLEGAMKIGNETSEEFSKGGITLEFEKVLNPFFSHGAKKRYVGKIVWPQKDEIVVRGYEIRRTDSFDLQSEALMAVFEDILSGDTEKAIETARNIVKKVANGDVPISSLVISRTCKDYNYYKEPDSMANVQTAKKMEAKGYEFVPGMKVSWIVTNSKKTPQEVEPYIDGEDFDARPDWNYYARRVAMTLARVTEVFGWDENALLSGISQSTLFDSFGSSKREKRDKGPEKPSKTTTLDDFM